MAQLSKLLTFLTLLPNSELKREREREKEAKREEL